MNEFIYENLDKLSNIFPPKIYEKLNNYKSENNLNEFENVLEITLESNQNLLQEIKEFEFLEKRKILSKNKAKELFLKYLKVEDNILNEFLNLVPLYYEIIEKLAQNIKDEKELKELIETIKNKIIYKENIAGLVNNISIIYQDLGDLERALEFAKKALEIYLFNKTKNSKREDIERVEVYLNKLKDEINTKIKQVEINNFKLLQNFEIELSENINIIIGTNSSGKSSLLQAIALASMPKNNEDEPQEISKYFTKDKNQIDIKLSFINSTKKELTLFSDEDLDKKLNINFNFLILGYGSNIFTEYGIKMSVNIEEKIIFAKGERKYFTKSLFNEKFRGFNDILIILYELDKFENDENTKIIKNIFINTINNFLEKFEIVKKKNNYYFEDFNKRLLKLEDLSEGYKNLTLLLSDILIRLFIHRDKKIDVKDTLLKVNATILIDEFDRHLHPTWQSGLVTKLKKTFPNIQFILTTHNPMSILDREPNEIINLETTKDGIKAVNKNIGTKTIDVGMVLLKYFKVDSLVGKTMQDKIEKFTKLKIKNELSKKEENKLIELEDFLEDTVATNFIYNNAYFEFLKFVKNNEDIDFEKDELNDLSDEELDKLLNKYKESIQ